MKECAVLLMSCRVCDHSALRPLLGLFLRRELVVGDLLLGPLSDPFEVGAEVLRELTFRRLFSMPASRLSV